MLKRWTCTFFKKDEFSMQTTVLKNSFEKPHEANDECDQSVGQFGVLYQVGTQNGDSIKTICFLWQSMMKATISPAF